MLEITEHHKIQKISLPHNLENIYLLCPFRLAMSRIISTSKRKGGVLMKREIEFLIMLLLQRLEK